jgi:hypothetical protein
MKNKRKNIQLAASLRLPDPLMREIDRAAINDGYETMEYVSHIFEQWLDYLVARDNQTEELKND